MVARQLDHPTNTGIVDGQVVLDFSVVELDGESRAEPCQRPTFGELLGFGH